MHSDNQKYIINIIIRNKKNNITRYPTDNEISSNSAKMSCLPGVGLWQTPCSDNRAVHALSLLLKLILIIFFSA